MERVHIVGIIGLFMCTVSCVEEDCRAVLFHTADSAHKQVPLCSHNTDYMDSLHEPVNTLARIWWWPPEDGSLVWSETCRGERILCDFNVFFNKYVHELVTIDTGSWGCDTAPLDEWFLVLRRVIVPSSSSPSYPRRIVLRRLLAQHKTSHPLTTRVLRSMFPQI